MEEPGGIARPISFDDRSGAGVRRALCLGGGGLFFIAWMSAYVEELKAGGVDLARADRVVGTSAGSVVGAALCAGHLGRVRHEMSLIAKVPSSLTDRLMSAEQVPSQMRAIGLAQGASDAEPATIHAIGYAALAATSSSARVMKGGMGLLVGTRRWPSDALEVTCVDTYSAERCVVTAVDEVPLLDAVAASCAVPGFAAPQKIGDRLCMDGGMCGTGVHLDRAAGAERAFVISLSGADGLEDGTLTIAPGSAQVERDQLEASGTALLHRHPEAASFTELMAPASVPGALAMGARQGRADLEAVRAFWG
jgi:NTE family protein